MSSCVNGHPVFPGAESCDICGGYVRPRGDDARLESFAGGPGAEQAAEPGDLITEYSSGSFTDATDYTSGSFADILAEENLEIPEPPVPDYLASGGPAEVAAEAEPAPAGPAGVAEPAPAGPAVGERAPAPAGSAGMVKPAGFGAPAPPKAADSAGPSARETFPPSARPPAQAASQKAPAPAGSATPLKAVPRGPSSTQPMDFSGAVGLGRGQATGPTSTQPLNLSSVVGFAGQQPKTAPGAPGAPGAPPPAAGSTKGRRPWRLVAAIGIVLVLAIAVGGAWSVLHHSARSAQAAGNPSATASSGPAASGPPTPAAGVTGPARWSSPVTIDQQAQQSANAFITGVSCPEQNACWAVDSAGNVLSYHGASNWPVVTTDTQGGLVAISCASLSSCLALDSAGNVLTFSQGSWGSPGLVDSGSGAFTAISCPSSTFCMTVDSGGSAFALTGSDPGSASSWTPFTVDSTGEGLTSVSCTSASNCVAAGSSGDIYVYDGTSWGAADAVDSGNALLGISCSGPAFCVAVDSAGNGAVLSGGKWTVGPIGMVTAGAVSCSAVGSCVAVGGQGRAAVYRGTAWLTAKKIDGSATVDALSCAAPEDCAAIDHNDNVMYYTSAGAGLRDKRVPAASPAGAGPAPATAELGLATGRVANPAGHSRGLWAVLVAALRGKLPRSGPLSGLGWVRVAAGGRPPASVPQPGPGGPARMRARPRNAGRLLPWGWRAGAGRRHGWPAGPARPGPARPFWP